MKCRVCDKDKLSKEFAPATFTEECDHKHLRRCLRCMVEYLETSAQCPDDDCDVKLAAAEQKGRLDMYRGYLNVLYPEISVDAEEFGNYSEPVEGSGTLTISLINGEKFEIPFDENWTVTQLRRYLREKGKQDKKFKLVHRGQELKGNKPLKEFNVKVGSTVHLLRVLLEVSDDLKHILFDLYWQYDASSEYDFPDASCLLYAKNKFTDYIDFDKDDYYNGAIIHSGDKVDKIKKIGSHRLEVRLDKIPKQITRVFFALSAWNINDLNKFKNIHLKFFDYSSPFSDLVTTEIDMKKVAGWQAVVICYLERSGDAWEVIDCESARCPGNTDNYSPIKRKIDELINKSTIV